MNVKKESNQKLNFIRQKYENEYKMFFKFFFMELSETMLNTVIAL